MKTQLVTIETNDIPIDGAFHEPDGETCAAALYFHGNTMNFYTGGARFLPPVLTKLGIAVLAFNRRGHDILTTRASRAAEGGAFQTSAQAIADNRYAAQWLAARGFANPIVMGHSNGGISLTEFLKYARKNQRMDLISGMVVSAVRNESYFEAPIGFPISGSSRIITLLDWRSRYTPIIRKCRPQGVLRIGLRTLDGAWE